MIGNIAGILIALGLMGGLVIATRSFIRRRCQPHSPCWDGYWMVTLLVAVFMVIVGALVNDVRVTIPVVAIGVIVLVWGVMGVAFGLHIKEDAH